MIQLKLEVTLDYRKTKQNKTYSFQPNDWNFLNSFTITNHCYAKQFILTKKRNF